MQGSLVPAINPVLPSANMKEHLKLKNSSYSLSFHGATASERLRDKRGPENQHELGWGPGHELYDVGVSY